MKRIIVIFSIIVLFLSETNAQFFTNYTTNDGLVSNYVNAITIDGEGNIWFGTSGGVSKFDGTDWISYTHEDGLIAGDVRAIEIDADGNKWFGHWIVGGPMGFNIGFLSFFDGTDWTSHFNAEEDIRGVTSIAIEAEGNIWIGINGDGVLKYDGTDWISYTPEDGLIAGSVRAIEIDADGNKWFGTYDGGVSKFDDTNWTNYTMEDGLANNGVSSIAIDSEDNKWFGTYDGGVSKFDGANWTNYTMEDGLANNDVSSIAIDSEDNKWFGTEDGVSKFDGTNWITFTTEDGLAENSVSSIAIDLEGNKWFGTINEGVSKFGSTTHMLMRETHLRIYPNPTNILLNIETENPDCYSIEIHSLNGQLIYKEEMEGNSKQIDLSLFRKGVYFITVRSDAWVRTEKVVKY